LRFLSSEQPHWTMLNYITRFDLKWIIWCWISPFIQVHMYLLKELKNVLWDSHNCSSFFLSSLWSIRYLIRSMSFGSDFLLSRRRRGVIPRYCSVAILSWAQFHQHSMYSFYARRSQKHKKTLGGNSQNFLRKFVRFIVTLGLKILRL